MSISAVCVRSWIKLDNLFKNTPNAWSILTLHHNSTPGSHHFRAKSFLYGPISISLKNVMNLFRNDPQDGTMFSSLNKLQVIHQYNLLQLDSYHWRPTRKHILGGKKRGPEPKRIIKLTMWAGRTAILQYFFVC